MGGYIGLVTNEAMEAIMQIATATKYASLTVSQLETAIYWVDLYAERARWDGFSRVAGRGRAALRDLKAELASRTREPFKIATFDNDQAVEILEEHRFVALVRWEDGETGWLAWGDLSDIREN
jgi:hypothetical protein